MDNTIRNSDHDARQDKKISIALKVRAKNGILQKFIDSRGWKQADFARALNVPMGTVGKWFNMQTIPSDDMSVKISALVSVPIEKIFPQVLTSKEIKRKFKEYTLFKDVDEADLLLLDEPNVMKLSYSSNLESFDIKNQIDLSLSTLTLNQQMVLRKRFYEDLTIDEIGRDMNLSKSRIKQIESKALQKLRHPSRSKPLKELIIR